VNKKNNLLALFLLTPIFFLITHAIAYLTHEYAHSFSAWAFGYKHNPFGLSYGNASLENILLLEQVSENVDYDVFRVNHPWIAAFVAFAGFGVGNLFLYIISIVALFKKQIKSPYYIYFFLWLAVMNLGNFIDYVPGRTFATHGDIAGIITFLNISPWWIMVIIGYPICYSVWHFYSRVLPYSYRKLEINRIPQSIILILISITLFMFFGAVGAEGYGDLSRLIALLSIYMTPIVVIACWPWRRWMNSR